MSDVLPLVVATLKGKIAIDVQGEISKRRKAIRQLVEVKIMHTAISDDVNEIVAYAPEVVVYASGSFEDGKPGEHPNVLGADYEQVEITWQVDFKPGATCRLSDLRKCQLYV
ncbi:MAG: hypothetical protein SGBAC_011315 [Bacillariaceae sp.]